ncbi:uncharacterized protein LOC141903369 [Tubulanus polymorphus]|uniref:uncharacterized protein LOC141903369 n=1 Tax=Tubulanus polymorphus TaxID=672921 RepID=UPI003DA33C0F
MEELKKVKMLNVEQLIVHVGTNNMTRDVPLEIVLRRHVELIRLLLYKCTGTIIVPALFPRCDDFDADTKIFYRNSLGCYNRSCHNTKRFNRKRKSVEHVIHPQTDPADSTCFCGVEFTNWKDLLDHVSLNHTEMRTMEEEGKDAACDNFSEGTIEEAEKMQEDSSKERIERLKMQEDSWMENKKQLSITGGGGIEPIIIDD